MLSAEMKASLDNGFKNAFGCDPERYFSAPGRTELSGNHTDHQHGRVLAAAVNLDTKASVRRTDTGIIRVQSAGYPLCVVNLDDMQPKKEEENTTQALIRGMAAGFASMGCSVGGFDAYVESTVLPGSGLSSSAAFEVLIGTIIDHLFFEGKAGQQRVARIGQYAENRFFGKPCGLMDQMASAVGGLVAMDFADPENPVITPVDFDFGGSGYALCIIDTQASHADLTHEYAAIPAELKKICAFFGKDVLREVEETEFYKSIPQLRQRCGDRAVVRAIHVYEENKRVAAQIAALQTGDFETYLSLMKESGHSSYMYLQNVIPAGSLERQDMAVALAMCDKLLKGRGGYRVHGGGFAGTVQAFVPTDMLTDFQTGIEEVLGNGACHVLSIRQPGGIELTVI